MTGRVSTTTPLPKVGPEYDQREHEVLRRSIEQKFEELSQLLIANRDLKLKPSSLAMRRLQFMAASGFGADLADGTEHNQWLRAQGTSIVTLSDAASVSWNAAPSNVYELTLGGNRTMSAPTGIKPGYTYILFLIQDGTGSRTVTWNSVFKWAGGTAPTLSTGAGAIDVLTFVARSTSALYGSLGIADGQ